MEFSYEGMLHYQFSRVMGSYEAIKKYDEEYKRKGNTVRDVSREALRSQLWLEFATLETFYAGRPDYLDKTLSLQIEEFIAKCRDNPYKYIGEWVLRKQLFC